MFRASRGGADPRSPRGPSKVRVCAASAPLKEGDTEGDYFDAWLRECHREIHDDVDTSDPAELRSAKWVESESSSRRYDLGAIRIPDYESAFQELRAFDFRSRSSTRRERVLAKILVDAFQLRL
eukprot:1617087-Pyramimonas_sp.AAC.1